MTSPIERCTPVKLRELLKALHFPFNEDGSATAWATAVCRTLYKFHKDLPQPHILRQYENCAYVDQVFHDFLRQHGKTLLGRSSEFRGRNDSVPVYHHAMSTARVNQLFRPLRSALLFCAQQWRSKYKRDCKFESSIIDSPMHDAPNTDAKWTDIHLRFPEYSQDDLINDEHSEVTKLNALRPWIIRYLPGDPRPAGCDGTNTKSYPVVRRICRGSPNGDWYVHWSQDGHKSWQLLQWNLADRCYHLHHQDGSIQRVEWVQQGGVPGSFVDESERRSNDNEIVIPLLTKQEVNQIQTHKTVYAYHTDTDESESPKPRRPGRNYQVRRQSQYTKSVSPLSDESKSGLKRTLGGKVVPFSDEGNRQELLPSKLVNREVSHPFSDSRDHTLHRQSSCTQRVSAKAIPRQVTVKPCVLDDHFVWGEWSYGKLSSLDVASLFMRVAESYNIDTSTLEEVEFHFIDLMPEETDIVRRGSVSDFEQVMSRIREEVRTNAETYTSFWVGLRPVIKATDGDVDIDM